MKFTTLSAIAFLAFPILGVGVAKAETDEPRAKILAADFVRKSLHLDPSHPLRATRREDLEDDLFRLQVKIKGKISKTAFFFEITENGYFVLSPDEAIYVQSADADRVWIVAVSVREDHVYGLYGFPDGPDRFRNLVGSSHLSVLSKDDAQAAALLFFGTVKDPHLQTLVLDSRQLKRKVEDYLMSKLPERDVDAKLSTWWHSYSAARLSNQLGVRSIRTGESYAVSITHLRSVDGKTVQLVAVELTVGGTGVCEVGRTHILYAPNTVAVQQ